MLVYPTEVPVSIRVIGYRVKDKFPALVLERDYYAAELDDLCNAMPSFSGLVIFHAGEASRQQLLNRCRDVFDSGQAGVLLISTDGFAMPHNTSERPFIHYHSRKIPNACDDIELQTAFQNLIEKCARLDTLPVAERISQLWELVDPSEYANRLRMLRELEEVLLAGPTADGRILPEYDERVCRFFPQARLTYSELKDRYLAWCCGVKKKSDLNRWQLRREHLNHQVFQHGFYDLVARPSVVAALDKFGRRMIPVLDPSIRKVLARWQGISAEFRDLFAKGNPAAISECDLMVAFLRPMDSDSESTIARYRERFGHELEQALSKASRALEDVDGLVMDILVSREQGSVDAHPVDIDFGVQLTARCQRLSGCVSSLRLLSALAERHHA